MIKTAACSRSMGTTRLKQYGGLGLGTRLHIHVWAHDLSILHLHAVLICPRACRHEAPPVQGPDRRHSIAYRDDGLLLEGFQQHEWRVLAPWVLDGCVCDQACVTELHTRLPLLQFQAGPECHAERRGTQLAGPISASQRWSGLR